jgi:hypothetical protein
MEIILKKSLKIGSVKLEKGTKGFVRSCEISSTQGDKYLVDFGGHTFVPVEVSLTEIVKQNENKKL